MIVTITEVGKAVVGAWSLVSGRFERLLPIRALAKSVVVRSQILRSQISSRNLISESRLRISSRNLISESRLGISYRNLMRFHSSPFEI